MGYLSYRSSEAAVDKMANQVMNELGDRIDQNLINHLHKPTEINRNNAASIKLGILDWRDLATVEKYFWQQSQIFPEISAVAIANEQKEILIVEKLDDGSRVIRLRHKSTNNVWDNYLADSDGNRIKLLRRSTTYDPHNDPPNNPWYGQTKNAGRSLWQINVSLATPNMPSLIAVNFLPFFDRDNNFQGVLGASVSLTQLGDFLQKLKIGKTGQAFIIDRNGKMIGMSTGEIPFRQGILTPLTQDKETLAKNVNPDHRRLSVFDSQNTTTKVTANHLKERFGRLESISERQKFRFEKDGIRYFVRIVPLKNEVSSQDLDWLSVLVIPESDFMSEIQANTNWTILFCGLILFVAIGMGLLTTRWISRPILRLSKASESIAKGDWQSFPEDLAIAELKTLATSFNWMSAQLHQAFVQVENSLQESEDKFATIFQVSPDPVWISTLSEGKYLYVNQSLCHFLGIPQSDIIGNTFIELNLWTDVEDIEDYQRRLISEGNIQNFEVEIRTAIGDVKTVLISASLVYLDGQDCEIGIMKDISDRNQLKIKLIENESRLEAFLNNMPAICYIKDLEGKYLNVNKEFERVLKISQEEMSGRTDYDFLPIEVADSLRANDRQAISQQSTIQVEETVEFPDGIHTFFATKFPLRDLQGNIYAMAGISMDVSDRKQTESDLRESQADLKTAYIEQNTLFNALTDVILVRNAEGHCLKVAPTKGLNLKGTQEEVLSKPIQEELPIEVANLILQTIHKALTTKQMASCDYVLEIDGREIWFSSNISPLSADTVIQISRDITERKLSEMALAKAKEDAEAATRAKSEFLANMSHEIRTPMNGVLVMAQLLATTELTEDQEDFVKTILESGDVLLAVINDILDFSKIESGMLQIEQREFVLAEVLSSVCNLMNGQAKDKKIELQFSIDPDVPLKVIGDSSRLRQILINLVGNAIKFTPQGKVLVGVSGSPLSDCEQYELKFAVTDTGIGIQGDRISNLFQAFTQADTSISRKYGGTGLGLAISRRLIELMDGTIWVESFGEVGGNPPLNWQSNLVTQGATFYFVIKTSLERVGA
ncbi:signal transduction histidine kinase [Pseudanabaena sp. lw0831]|nr:signal transduction histidine kinase [Pseudanabaena sp. lw0831]